MTSLAKHNTLSPILSNPVLGRASRLLPSIKVSPDCPRPPTPGFFELPRSGWPTGKTLSLPTLVAGVLNASFLLIPLTIPIYTT